jgi:alkaline phosphatase D
MQQRRTFLRALLTTASAALLGGACNNEGDDLGPIEPGERFFPQSLASGDPRPDSVILWTRLGDPDHPLTEPHELHLQLATDEQFTDLLALDGGDHLVVTAEPAYGGCVKVKVRGLDPATTYFYRFLYPHQGVRWASRTGQTRTAPAEDADQPVRFAYVSCQDYSGRHYNVYRELLRQQLDFFVHLGDYIYETTTNPEFQDADGRRVDFDDQAGAIAFNQGQPGEYYAARSLDNYRQLYRIYRTDPALQAVHERLPMVAIWDDHEFSNDSHGATGTYQSGRVDERDVDRRKAANQAWFEFMPVDYPGDTGGPDDFRYDPAADFPGDLRIHRDFTYGRHLHLVLTDLRTYRSDHLIPEDAFPAALALDQPALLAALGQLPDAAAPYFDVDTYAGGVYQVALRAGADALGYDPAKITGHLDAATVNALLAELPGDQPPLLDDAAQAGMERGLAFIHLGKTSYYSSFGARYLVIKDTYDLYSKVRYAADAGAAEVAMGPDQESWFLGALTSSDHTWKIWGNEYLLMPTRIDLSPLPLPPAFAHQFYLGADAWDGQPSRRDFLLKNLAGVDNLVVITGDIHAFFAGFAAPSDDPGARVIELVTSSVTSTTFGPILERLAVADPTLMNVPGAVDLARNIRDLLIGLDTNPHIAHADVVRNGFVSVELDGAALTATMHAIANEEAKTDYAGREDELSAKFERLRLRVNAGERELYRDFDGAWRRWDTTTRTWL